MYIFCDIKHIWHWERKKRNGDNKDRSQLFFVFSDEKKKQWSGRFSLLILYPKPTYHHLWVKSRSLLQNPLDVFWDNNVISRSSSNKENKHISPEMSLSDKEKFWVSECFSKLDISCLKQFCNFFWVLNFSFCGMRPFKLRLNFKLLSPPSFCSFPPSQVLSAHFHGLLNIVIFSQGCW